MEGKVKIPEGLWIKCEFCKNVLFRLEMERNLKVCPQCKHHFKLHSQERLKLLVDENSFCEIGKEIKVRDPLSFNDDLPYSRRLKQETEKNKMSDAAIFGTAKIGNYPVIIMILDFFFMGGSMGIVVGEKFALSAEEAINIEVPLICVAASGGARMQEGMFSLMQMAKTSAVVTQMKNKGIPFISILTNPTFGGVTASFAMLGDIIIAEPGSLIGFAGPRVIEQTIKQKLPDNFQKAEFQLEHGMIDMIVHRKELKNQIVKILSFFSTIELSGGEE